MVLGYIEAIEEYIDTRNLPGKGKVQPKAYRDTLFGLLFFIQLAVMIALGINYRNTSWYDDDRRLVETTSPSVDKYVGQLYKGLNVVAAMLVKDANGANRLLEENYYYVNANANNNESGTIIFTEESISHLLMILYSWVIAFTMSVLLMFTMIYFPSFMIKAGMIFNISASIALIGIGRYFGTVLFVIFGSVLLMIFSCYLYSIWRRVPFAANNLSTASAAVRDNFFLTVVAHNATIIMISYIIFWLWAAVSTYIAMGQCNSSFQCQEHVSGYVISFMFLSLYWTYQVIKYVVHVIVAGTVGVWWSHYYSSNPCYSNTIKQSTKQALTYSFGSICSGSLFTPIIQSLRQTFKWIMDNGDGLITIVGYCGFVFLNGCVGVFNDWSFVYVGMYGYNFFESGLNVNTLFEARGWISIIDSTFFTSICGMLSFGVGMTTGIGSAYLSFYQELNLEGGAFILGFVFGFTLSQVLMSVIGSAVNTVIVCYAEDPIALETNHPSLSGQMLEAWQEAHPVEFDYIKTDNPDMIIASRATSYRPDVELGSSSTESSVTQTRSSSFKKYQQPPTSQMMQPRSSSPKKYQQPSISQQPRSATSPKILQQAPQQETRSPSPTKGGVTPTPVTKRSSPERVLPPTSPNRKPPTTNANSRSAAPKTNPVSSTRNDSMDMIQAARTSSGRQVRKPSSGNKLKNAKQKGRGNANNEKLIDLDDMILMYRSESTADRFL
jgi:hypothetical protein